MSCVFFFSSRRRHTRCALVTGVQTCALPISIPPFASTTPVTPPMTNMNMKPNAQSMGVSKRSEPPHIVAIHENTFYTCDRAEDRGRAREVHRQYHHVDGRTGRAGGRERRVKRDRKGTRMKSSH